MQLFYAGQIRKSLFFLRMLSRFPEVAQTSSYLIDFTRRQGRTPPRNGDQLCSTVHFSRCVVTGGGEGFAESPRVCREPRRKKLTG